MKHEYTADEARAWLLATGKYQRILSALERKYNAINERLPSARLSKLTGMPRGGAHDWQTDVDKLVDERRELAARMRKALTLIKAREDVIASIDRTEARMVLSALYLQGLRRKAAISALHMPHAPFDRWHARGLALVAGELTRRVERAPIAGTDAAAIYSAGVKI